MIYTIVKKNKAGDAVAIISFDSVTSFDESWSATVTSQTVEKGFDITDNVNIEPPTYSISGVLSSYSLFSLDNEIVWDGKTFSTKRQVDNDSKHILARDAMLDIFQSRVIVNLVESNTNSNSDNPQTFYEETQWGYFNEINNCIITKLNINNPSQGGGAFDVSMTIQKVHVAKVSTAQLAPNEMQKELIGFVKKPATVATNGKSAEEAAVTATNTDGSPQEPQKPKTLPDGTMTWEEGNRIHTEKVKSLEDRMEYMRRTDAYASQNNLSCTVIVVANGLDRECYAL